MIREIAVVIDPVHAVGGRDVGRGAHRQGQRPEPVGVSVGPGAVGDEARRTGGAGLGSDGVEVAAQPLVGRESQLSVLEGFTEPCREVEAPRPGEQHALDPCAAESFLPRLDDRLAHARLIDGDPQRPIPGDQLGDDLRLRGKGDALLGAELAHPGDVADPLEDDRDPEVVSAGDVDAEEGGAARGQLRLPGRGVLGGSNEVPGEPRAAGRARDAVELLGRAETRPDRVPTRASS